MRWYCQRKWSNGGRKTYSQNWDFEWSWPDLLQTALDTFKKGTVCENAEYIQYLQPVVIQCNDCQAESEIKNDEYNCPKCNSSSFDIIDGEDLILMQLVLN